MRGKRVLLRLTLLLFAAVAGLVYWRFENDIAAASERAARGSRLTATRCGVIEYQEAGKGVPLLVVHGSGGGHDQGMALGQPLAHERARVHAMIEAILPVSARAQGLRDDSALGKSLTRYALESIRAPTLIVSARDDGYGAYASAQYTASQIAGANFIGFDEGGHVFVAHDEAIRMRIAKLLVSRAAP